MNKILNLIKNIVKIGTLISVDDSGNIPNALIQGLGKTQKSALLFPYGLEANPPANSLVITWAQNSIESSLISMATDPANRTKPLLVGEVKITNNVAGTSIYLKSDGTILVTGPVTFSGDITAGIITATEIEATIQIKTPIVTNDTVDLFLHKHVDPQGGYVGPPIAGP